MGRALVKEQRDENVRWFREYKSLLSCFFCNENYPACLDFHHLDHTKKDINISQMIRSSSKERILNEISKCIVLCSNCHRKVHAGVLQLEPKTEIIS